MIINLYNKMTDSLSGVVYIIVFIEMDFFFLEGSDKSFGIAILPKTPPMRQGNLNSMTNEDGNISCRQILPPLVTKVDFRNALAQCLLQRSQCELFCQVPTQSPTSYTIRVNTSINTETETNCPLSRT